MLPACMQLHSTLNLQYNTIQCIPWRLVDMYTYIYFSHTHSTTRNQSSGLGNYAYANLTPTLRQPYADSSFRKITTFGCAYARPYASLRHPTPTDVFQSLRESLRQAYATLRPLTFLMEPHPTLTPSLRQAYANPTPTDVSSRAYAKAYANPTPLGVSSIRQA